MQASGSSRKFVNRLFTAAVVRARQKNAGIVCLRRVFLTQPWRQLRRQSVCELLGRPTSLMFSLVSRWPGISLLGIAPNNGTLTKLFSSTQAKPCWRICNISINKLMEELSTQTKLLLFFNSDIATINKAELRIKVKHRQNFFREVFPFRSAHTEP